MSRFDLERFTVDTKKDPGMMDEVSRLEGNPQALVRWAAQRGYQLTPDEAHGLASSVSELSDQELENVAGGWDGTTPPPSGGG